MNKHALAFVLLGILLIISALGIAHIVEKQEVKHIEKTICYDRYRSEIIGVECEREVIEYKSNFVNKHIGKIISTVIVLFLFGICSFLGGIGGWLND